MPNTVNARRGPRVTSNVRQHVTLFPEAPLFCTIENADFKQRLRLNCWIRMRIIIRYTMNTVYIETSIVSYLRHRASSQVVMAARQLLTHQWWNHERANYDLVISQYVIDEASAGDATLAAERLQSLEGIPLLPLDPDIALIADEIMARAILPPKARTDALHIAIVAHHRIQYLLTWNCRHIANARILPRIHEVLTDLFIPIPIICTPEEMLANDSATDDRSDH